ncbi:hypothetical protein NDU88_004321 [Pleurodeles waltl]|uniref:Reverse transcriptase domain-containing protein n=1 Tax=Pleurodeles waltl TaxID=8319 RepID=A0AAV7L1M3_PLEWA|nr:hypothetical protein NDU88_004321 [Pleurodeles waltl]
MEEGTRVFITKPEKDHLKCLAYRWIALQNLDMKICMKVLAMQLRPILPKLIHEDQSGFVNVRQAFDNISRIAQLVKKTKRKVLK